MNANDPERSNASAAGVPPPPQITIQPTTPFGVRQTRRTRRTVDLSPAQHRALDVWQREAADRIGRARVTGQEVLSALVDRLLSDPGLSAEVIRTIRARR